MRNRYYQASTGRFIQRDPIGYAGGLNLYSYCAGDPVNFSDPSGLEPYEPGPWDVWGRQHSPEAQASIAKARSDSLIIPVFGSDETAIEFVEFLLVQAAWEAGMRAGARILPRSKPPTAPAKPNPFAAARRGDSVHYDEVNGRPGTQSGPTAIQNKYPDTEFQFAKQGEKGVDVTVTGGKMPWEYNGSNWPKGVRTADIKPGNRNGYETFVREVKKGKIPAGSIPLPYHIDTLKVYVP
jgi:uncharacterized protein RhaS with RHS repeats